MADYKYQKAVVIGNGKLALDCARLIGKYISDVCVVEYMYGRSSSLEKHCGKAGFLYELLDKEGLTKYLSDIEEETLVVSAGSIYIVPEELIARDNLCFINWHNALLPEHKGRFAESWAIFSGDPETGITWHMLTREIDGGDIIIQCKIPLSGTETALSLFKKQCELGSEALSGVIGALLEGKVTLTPMPKGGTLHLSKDIPGGGVLDLGGSFKDISAMLRAMDYGALMLLGKTKVSIEGELFSFYKYKISDEPVTEGFFGKDYGFCKDGKYILLKDLERVK